MGGSSSMSGASKMDILSRSSPPMDNSAMIDFLRDNLKACTSSDSSRIALYGSLSSRDIGMKKVLLYANILGHLCKIEIGCDTDRARNLNYSVYVIITPGFSSDESAEIKFPYLAAFKMQGLGNPRGKYGPFEFVSPPNLSELNFTFTWKVGKRFSVDKTPNLDSGRCKMIPSAELSKSLLPIPSAELSKSLLPIPSAELSKNLLQMYKNQEMCDVVLNVQGEKIPAHKTILSAASPVFKTMFESNFREASSNEVEIDDFEAKAIRRMLWFIYTYETPTFSSPLTKPHIVPLYEAAHKYDIKQLLQLCSNELASSISVDTALDRLLMGEKYEDADLKRKALEFICKNPPSLHDVSKCQRIVEQQPGLLKDMLACKFS